MNSRDRVFAALDRKPFDRIPVKHYGTPEVDAMLLAHFAAPGYDGLLDCLGDDFRNVGPAWCGPELRHFKDGSWEGWWGERYNNISFGTGTYPEAVYLPFAAITDPADLRRFRFPSAGDFDYTTLREQCARYAGYAVIFGDPGYLDFINGTARCRGVEQVLLDIANNDPVYAALVEQRFTFFYEMTERVLQTAGDLIDIVHMGEDLGTQGGLLLSPRTFDRLLADKFRAYFALVHRYGKRAMMHSCGSVRRLIPRLIDLGLDILDVVQVSAQGMDIHELQAEFSRDLCFCGSIDVQTTLPFGTPHDVAAEVALRLRLFAGGGLILGPTHAIQAGTPLENILALYEAAGSLQQHV